MSLFGCLFPISSKNGEPQQAEILRDDSPWDWEGFKLKNIWIRRTVNRKIKKDKACTIVYRLGLQGKQVRRRRYHKREGWDEEIGVRSGGEGNKFSISGSPGF